MKLAASNIAWHSAEDSSIASLMLEYGIVGVEIAPTKIWPEPLKATDEEINSYRRFWEQRSIQIVALQALLFGRPDLTIFESANKRCQTLEYLRVIMRLGGMLGAKMLVFGSPKNRRVHDLPPDEIDEIAFSFFHTAGEMALEYGVILCIEPNPPHYGCDYITTSAHGLELVSRVKSAGFRLHLDAGAMALSEESPGSVLENCGTSICHFHVSEPYLEPVGMGDTDHATIASALRRIDYPNWASLEMRHNPVGSPTVDLPRVLRFLRETYGD